MELTRKLRDAIDQPDDWDVPGLLEDAAIVIGELLEACKAVAYFPNVWANDPNRTAREETWKDTLATVEAAITKATKED